MVAMMIVGVLDSLFHYFIDEDHPIEWVQFFAILIASMAFARRGDPGPAAGPHRLAAIYVVVAVGAFLAAGEEISWGQRMLGFATPGAARDDQPPGRVEPPQHLDDPAPVQPRRDAGRPVRPALPLLWLVPAVRARTARWLDPLLVPPLCLIVLFFLPFAYRAIRLVLLPDAGERIVELGEVPELTFYVGILVMGIVTARALRPGSRHVGPAAGSPTAPTA